jgi:DNA-binding NtrC family response regulator
MLHQDCNWRLATDTYENEYTHFYPRSGHQKRKRLPRREFNYAPSRILLVEDEKAIRDVLVPILFSAGFDCREAADGRAALDVLQGGTRINLVLSNMLLPEVDGWTLFLYVRKKYPKVPFVFVTAIDDYWARKAAMREGAVGYLLKPFTCDDFVGTVRRVIG